MTKFKGFTLAEVLITLGIIGVVAAMTMPTLINSTQGAQYKTAFKKSLTVLSQAVVMNIALNDYDLSQVVAGDSNYADQDTDMGSQTLYDMFNERLNIVRRASTSDFNATAGDADNWTIVSDTDSGDRGLFATEHGETNAGEFTAAFAGNTTWPADHTVLFMNDGIAFIFDNTQSNCMEADTGVGVDNDNYCYGFIDVNGQKAPNRVVQCDGVDGSGATADDIDEATCNVSNPTDIYPIALHDQSIIPASVAARAVLYNK